jgi:hypothetical protein
MGDALLDQEEELLLCTLPFPENHELIDKIRKAHPRFKIIYYTVGFSSEVLLEEEVPEGKSILRGP